MRGLPVIIGIFLAIAIVGVSFQIIQAQGPRRQQDMESTWAAIAFELRFDYATLEKARPHFQKAWEERKKLMEAAEGDFTAISDGTKKIMSDLNEKLRTVLTEEKNKELAEWVKAQQPRRPSRGAPPTRTEIVDLNRYILTPKPPETPRINGAKVFGVRQGRPFLYTIPATGKRPMRFSADNLSEGLKLDANTGRITGKIEKRGKYVVTLNVENELGKATREFRIMCGDNISLTPPLGWNSWNCWARAVDEEKVRAAAKAMTESGLVNHGWTYINIDDTWQGERGGPFMGIQGNEKFPDMKALCDYVHSLGLKIGIYSTPWTTSYAGFIGGASNNKDGSWAPEPRTGGGFSRRFSAMQAVENTWAVIAFELKVDSATLRKAQPLFQKSLDERTKMMSDTEGGFQAMSEGIEKINSNLDESLKTVLTAGKVKELAEWKKAQEKQAAVQQTQRDRHGKYSFAQNDANQWAAWGFDYLKYDWNPNDVPHVSEMAEALKASGRDVVYSLSNSAPFEQAAEWARLANCWRTTGDIRDSWQSMSRIGFSQSRWSPYSGPGHWNDSDMLVVGKVGWGPELRPSGLTPDEQYTHISLWCLLASPLLLGCDLTELDDFTLSLLTNDEVLNVNQDPLGKQAVCVIKSGDSEVWAKDMEDGSKAVGLFNLGPSKTSVSIRWSDMGIRNNKQRVRDLWRQKNLGVFEDRFEAEVPSHGVVLVQIFPVSDK